MDFNYISTEIVKDTNKLLGHKMASLTSVGLLMKFPIEFRVEKVDKKFSEFSNNNINSLKKILLHIKAYVEMGDITKLNIVIMQFKNETEKTLDKLIKKHSQIFSIIYLHEVQHIMRMHNTQSYSNYFRNACKKLGINYSDENMHEFENIVEDYAINWTLKQLAIYAKFDTKIFNEILYKEEYEGKNEIEILKKMKKNNDMPSFAKVMITNNGIYKVSVESGDNTIEYIGSSEGNIKEGNNNINNEYEKTASSLSDTLSKEYSQAIERGALPEYIKKKVIPKVEVNVNWFNQLQKYLESFVYYETNKYTNTWSSLNNKLRRIAKFPKHRYIDSIIDMIVSIDQSGSMTSEDLGKFLYVIDKFKKKIGEITVIIHDYKIAKVFDYKNVTSESVKNAFGTRYVAGGTSHADVFEYIDKMKLNRRKYIYISFSDNYSDIESVYKNWKTRKQFKKYFISPINNPIKINDSSIINITI